MKICECDEDQVMQVIPMFYVLYFAIGPHTGKELEMCRLVCRVCQATRDC